jgi:hypothetical protein
MALCHLTITSSVRGPLTPGGPCPLGLKTPWPPARQAAGRLRDHRAELDQAQRRAADGQRRVTDALRRGDDFSLPDLDAELAAAQAHARRLEGHTAPLVQLAAEARERLARQLRSAVSAAWGQGVAGLQPDRDGKVAALWEAALPLAVAAAVADLLARSPEPRGWEEYAELPRELA